jgi:hypothetical protein
MGTLPVYGNSSHTWEDMLESGSCFNSIFGVTGVGGEFFLGIQSHAGHTCRCPEPIITSSHVTFLSPEPGHLVFGHSTLRHPDQASDLELICYFLG